MINHVINVRSSRRYESLLWRAPNPEIREESISLRLLLYGKVDVLFITRNV